MHLFQIERDFNICRHWNLFAVLGKVMGADEIASTAIKHPNVVLVLQASADLFHSSKTAASVD